MASWIDLPESVAHLRFVPEMLVAMLADQKGSCVERNGAGDKTWFAVGPGFEDNVLLRVFHKGVVLEGELGSRTADRFDESADVGLDQLLMIRLAQQLGQAPDKPYSYAFDAEPKVDPPPRITAAMQGKNTQNGRLRPATRYWDVLPLARFILINPHRIISARYAKTMMTSIFISSSLIIFVEQ